MLPVVTERVGSDPSLPGRIKLGRRYWRLWTASVVSNLGDGVALIAYPWLASAVTRNAFLIGLIAVAQRLPWLIFTLPAGVMTDRLDRRRIMIAMDIGRAAVTLGVAFAVLARQDVLPAPADVAAGLELATDGTLYMVVLVASLVFGFAEVLRDNAAQTILPAIVEPEGLEKANGQMWGIELVANSFVGPPLGSILIGLAFALPFFFDAGTFAVAAVMVWLISGTFRADGAGTGERIAWRAEIAEGFGWLWRHPLLRPMAIVLGIMNGIGMLTFATLVLFAQEVLGTDAFEFAILGTGAALGGLAGTFLASRISARLGSGLSLLVVLVAEVVILVVIGVSSHWVIVWAALGFSTFSALLWNVITVSLRQTIIPDRLLGRVNSVYRFFGWGMMPIGSLIGGILVVGTESFGGRELALRMPWFVAAAGYLMLIFYAAPRLTTDKIEAARAEGLAAKDATAEAGLVADDALAEGGVAGAPPPLEDPDAGD